MNLLTRLKLIASGFGNHRDTNIRNYSHAPEDCFKITGCDYCDKDRADKLKQAACIPHGPWANSVMHSLGLELMNVKQCRRCGHMEKHQ